MPIEQIDPKRAQALVFEGFTYLDVRSVQEFERGHAPGAINVPLLHLSPQGMMPNPDFITVVAASVEKDARLVVGCAAGGRSQKACEELERAGWGTLNNIVGGFNGAKDPAGNVKAKGWSELGLPVSTTAGDGESYASLAKKAGC